MATPAELGRATLELGLRLRAKAAGVERPSAFAKYCHHEPTEKQAEFLALDCREAMFGGAAGGGKSDALLMDQLQWVHVPGFAGIIFRRTFSDLALPGGLMDRAHEWLDGSDAHWSEERKTWSFPTGAEPSSITFGYLEHPGDEYRYKSAEFQRIAFDELTTFLEKPYRYMFSRLRRQKSMNVPIGVRSASNPGDIGHQWVNQRFLVEGPDHGRVFVPAKLADNPYLDAESYLESLSELDEIDRQHLIDGDWTARRSGGRFRREDFKIIDQAPVGMRWVRRWDLAATEPKPGRDPDWTAGPLVGLLDGQTFIADMQRVRGTPKTVEDLVKDTAYSDGIAVPIRMEREPGSSGVNVIDHYAREVLVGFDFAGVLSSGDKVVRATILSSAAGHGNVYLVRGPWINDFLDEAEAFPRGAHDDQIDAVSGGMQDLKDGMAGSFTEEERPHGALVGVGGEAERGPSRFGMRADDDRRQVLESTWKTTL